MFVVFEGIDGSGKTTVSNKVAKALRARGIAVEHIREGGEFASSLVTRMRLFGKDPRNLVMEPWPELLFYLARETQLLHECVAPALAKGGLVFADRYLYSFDVLAHHGRGVPREPIRQVVDAVSGGVWPDLVFLMDVDPHLARARRQVSKIPGKGQGKGEGSGGGGSRKGLGGLGVQHRLRAGYRQLAAADPDRWIAFDNGRTDRDLAAVVSAVTDAIAQLVAGTAPAEVAQTARRNGALDLASSAPATAASPRSLDDAPAELFRRIAARAQREPAVAAYLVSGVTSDEGYDWLERLAESAPEVVAYGLRGNGDERAWQLRESLEQRVPYHVARSLDGLAVEGPRAEAMREALLARAPLAVLATLDGNDSDAAWRLRGEVAGHRADVVSSLKRLDGDNAWHLRDAYLDRIGGDDALADPLLATPLIDSLRGLASERAWRLRRLVADVVPTAVITSLSGVLDDESWTWRERFAERGAKLVFRTLSLVDESRAWALRRQHAEMVKEVLDSMIGMDGEDAWSIREACATVWPSTVVKSLAALGQAPRGRALAERLLGTHWDNISLLKHASRQALGLVAPPLDA